MTLEKISLNKYTPPCLNAFIYLKNDDQGNYQIPLIPRTPNRHPQLQTSSTSISDSEPGRPIPRSQTIRPDGAQRSHSSSSEDSMQREQINNISPNLISGFRRFNSNSSSEDSEQRSST